MTGIWYLRKPYKSNVEGTAMLLKFKLYVEEFCEFMRVVYLILSDCAFAEITTSNMNVNEINFCNIILDANLT